MKVLMKKAFVFAAVLVGLGMLAKLFGPKVQNIDWEKKFETMPDNAPPKWMFRNITAIRETPTGSSRLLSTSRTTLGRHGRFLSLPEPEPAISLDRPLPKGGALRP